ncbi:MAG TPA: hypothetical protein DD458_04445 [Prolixibacteraceae bacterium]|nr:hypothetical protein [Prolixibacteraceae bacterium]HCR90874.1 hypothetical protein [Prolixibacteraceae bacterium]HCU61940.1 hypothetical protein [Prolixibacteraceae bacterium]
MYYIAETNRYDRIPYKRSGKSGLKLPAISLGLWQNFGGVDSFENGRAVCKRAFDLGITHFDLANNYGPPYGSAEENFGKILRTDFKNYRDEMVISTKAGYDMWPGPYGEWGSRKYMLSSLDQSLKRMGLDYVDIFYSHRPDPETPLEETMGALAHAVKQGKALYVGISNYPTSLTLEASKILKELGTPCLIHQPRYSMLDRWVEDDGLLPVLEQEGIGCIAFSPLAQGLLTDRYLNGIPNGSRATKSRFLKPEQVIGSLVKIRQLNEMAIRRGQRLAQMALAWVLKDQRVTSVLIGASSVAQLETNVASLHNLTFSEEELQQIDTILNTPVVITKRTLVVPPGMMRKDIEDQEKVPGGSRHDFIRNLADRLAKNN